MARHLMAVCVVCLLCAEHLPCKQHFDDSVQDLKKILSNNQYTDNNIPSYIWHMKSSDTGDQPYNGQPSSSVPNKRRGRTKGESGIASDDTTTTTSTFGPADTSQRLRAVRSKRHAIDGHGHHDDNDVGMADKPPAHAFVEKIFQKFGNVDTLTMNVMGFEKMLKDLGLYELLDEKLSMATSIKNIQPSNDTCLSTVDFISRISSVPTDSLSQQQQLLLGNNQSEHTQLISNGHTTDATSTATLTTPSLLLPSSPSPSAPSKSVKNKTSSSVFDRFELIKTNLLLNSKDLVAICPILLYQLTAGSSSERAGCISSALVPVDFATHYAHDDQHMDELDAGSSDRMLVWIYATVSILIASLCGLLAVAVIPFMDKDYYQYLLQFFVALGVGTLAGDALLHLLPHAMLTYAKHEDPHITMTLKGLVAAAGMVFFFLTERSLTIITEWRKRIQKKEKPSSRVRVMRDPDTVSVHNPAGEKLCKAKYSSYPYCYDEIDMDTKDDHHHHNRAATAEDDDKLHVSLTKLDGGPVPSNNGDGITTNNTNHNHNHHKDNYVNHDKHDFLAAQSLLSSQNNYTISDNYVALNLSKVESSTVDGSGGGGGGGAAAAAAGGETTTVSTNLDNGSVESRKLAPEENYTIILREHESKHHGHSHTHGHVHSPPSSFSAVAWMVIMGDGLHNFTDGMAIGAAFSNNIAGGFSTALAVFCHELPHELGDFAILLQAGMSARQAIYYNMLSSVLSFIGAMIGIWIGEAPEASAWIFACAAGMFLYIALVDMMPELTSSHKESFAFTQLVLQMVGILSGVGIMLLIALYEHDLKEIFASDHKHG